MNESTELTPEEGSHASSKWQGLLRFGGRAPVPYIPQTQAAECGMACIAMIASFYGKKTDLLTLRTMFPLSLRGAKLKDLIDMAGDIGFIARPVQVALEDLSHLEAPSILHWNMSHFVVLVGCTKGEVEIIDPARGRRRMRLADVSKSFTGVALEMQPSEEFTKDELREAVSIRQLTGRVRGLKRGLLQVFAIAAATEALNLLAPQFLQLVVDQVIADSDKELLTILGIGFAVLLLLRVAANALRTWVIMWLSSTIGISWAGNVFAHLLRLPVSYFGQRHMGDLMSRYGSIGAIQSTITTSFVTAVIDGIMATVTLVVLFYYSGTLAMITIGFVMLYSVTRFFHYKTLRERSEEQINAVASQQTVLIESLRSMQTIKLNNQGPQRAGKFMNATAESINGGIGIQKIGLAFASINQVCQGLQRIIVIWVGATLALGGTLSVGMLMAFAAYSDQFTSRILSLIDYFVQFRLLRIQTERLADIVLTPPESHTDATYAGKLSSYSIEFKNINYQYASNLPKVVSSCSFFVAEGEVVAIVGPSGCGKTTVAKLLMGLLDYDSGQILIGGVDMRTLGKRRIRQLAATVFQDDQTFAGTIADNISLFDPGASLDQIREAAEAAEISDEIEQMPMGYYTLIGDMGGALSAGQIQRIFLARAFYKRPKILIMDEATSNLDISNEVKICAAVRRAKITTLLIAHRPQTIQSADRVLSMRNGRISSMGADRTPALQN
ncbi:peptidase domain-containing ABC transporter [Stenotrophomonas sp. 22692]|uniref:peptidase domain-containing ABC transporter n=1 Tax=Stenotrophomonas sp. 22692 TaxID=3453956 RepID=UPI003F87B33F